EPRGPLLHQDRFAITGGSLDDRQARVAAFLEPAHQPTTINEAPSLSRHPQLDAIVDSRTIERHAHNRVPPPIALQFYTAFPVSTSHGRNPPIPQIGLGCPGSAQYAGIQGLDADTWRTSQRLADSARSGWNNCTRRLRKTSVGGSIGEPQSSLPATGRSACMSPWGNIVATIRVRLRRARSSACSPSPKALPMCSSFGPLSAGNSR